MLSPSTLRLCDRALSTLLLEIDLMTYRELAEATKEVVAVGLWSSLFLFVITVGLIVYDGIVVF